MVAVRLSGGGAIDRGPSPSSATPCDTAPTPRPCLALSWAAGDLVFCTGEGKLLNPNNLYRSFAAIIDRAGVHTIRMLDLGRTHAMRLLRAGTPIKAVSERLGHAKTSITLNTYAHVLPDMQERAVEAIDAALFESTG
jgi:integrase